ncbi:MAG: hypothetical protein JXM71_08375 [Spirochaetales bacterium]|nr:hypothetical protein [Spirochaetales bacterium]
MLDTAIDFIGRVTFVTGPEKHCGKTTFMNRAASLVRQRVDGAPRLALLTVGYDGEARDLLSGARKPAVPIAVGDVFVTTERYARPCSPEILEALPGSTALGPLCVARARRAGTVALVGPEGNAAVARAIRLIVEGGLADTVFVDGAINRVTQAASLPGAQFVYTVRVDRASLGAAVAKVRRMATLARLPLFEAVAAAEENYASVEGALTADTAARLPESARRVLVEDFTKVFLGDSELGSFLRGRTLYVRRSVAFGGFVVVCRGVTNDDFALALDDADIAALIAFNPYEVTERGVA